MKELVDFLKANPLGCLATTKGDKPNARPFQFMLEDGGKLCFCTSNKKNVFAELKANPNACFSCSGPQTQYARIWGSVKFVTDAETKNKVIESNQLVRSIYRSADNPDFEVFYFTNGRAFLGDLLGHPSMEYPL
ncbi:MAG TPA: pyridoxamine 5'-phosphate oxidase family protein [Syntrophorhabdaceae bacterium]|nr:pyridoxamine 5'-phosphate oxidase family protein [Syntrophorhabdaceae bacterium]